MWVLIRIQNLLLSAPFIWSSFSRACIPLISLYWFTVCFLTWRGKTQTPAQVTGTGHKIAGGLLRKNSTHLYCPSLYMRRSSSRFLGPVSLPSSWKEEAGTGVRWGSVNEAARRMTLALINRNAGKSGEYIVTERGGETGSLHFLDELLLVQRVGEVSLIPQNKNLNRTRAWASRSQGEKSEKLQGHALCVVYKF